MSTSYSTTGLTEPQVKALAKREISQRESMFSGASLNGLAQEFRELNKLAEKMPQRAFELQEELFKICGYVPNPDETPPKEV